jgi:uncharacterized protein YlxW (UPF0749 family)
VGDRASLGKAIADSPAIQNYLQYVQAYGLGWKVVSDGKVTLPGYSGSVDLHDAQAVNTP